MSTTDHAGVSPTCDQRIHRRVGEITLRRPDAADYFRILGIVRPDIKAGALQDFEYNVDLLQEQKEKDNSAKREADKANGGEERGYETQGNWRQNRTNGDLGALGGTKPRGRSDGKEGVGGRQTKIAHVGEGEGA